METKTTYFPSIKSIEAASQNLRDVASVTPLMANIQYSKKFGSNVLFKREDLQSVRSYKIRGAYNKISSLTQLETKNGIVCASAGNHAQGVALSCKLLKIQGKNFLSAEALDFLSES